MADAATRRQNLLVDAGVPLGAIGAVAAVVGAGLGSFVPGGAAAVSGGSAFGLLLLWLKLRLRFISKDEQLYVEVRQLSVSMSAPMTLSPVEHALFSFIRMNL